MPYAIGMIFKRVLQTALAMGLAVGTSTLHHGSVNALEPKGECYVLGVGDSWQGPTSANLSQCAALAGEQSSAAESGTGVSRWQDVEIQAKPDGSYAAYQAGQLLTTGFWDVEKLVDDAVDDIDAFWRSEFEAREWAYESPGRVQAYSTRIRTACGRSVPDNAFYCRVSHSIYYDTGLMRDQFNDIGDFAPIVIVAHEWGHAIQAQRGIFRQVRSTFRLEQQADCFAGAYVASLKANGALSDEDAEEALDLIRALPRSRTHGTPRQRVAAYQKGFDGGATACLG